MHAEKVHYVCYVQNTIFLERVKHIIKDVSHSHPYVSPHPFNPVKVQMSVRHGYWQNNKADLFNQGCTIACYIDMSIKQHLVTSHWPLLIKIKCSLFIVELGLRCATETLSFFSLTAVQGSKCFFCLTGKGRWKHYTHRQKDQMKINVIQVDVKWNLRK